MVLNSLPPLPLINGALFVSNSFLEQLARCPRACQYYGIEKRVPADDSPGLVFGAHLHSAIEMHFRQKEFNLTQREVSEKVATLLQAEFAARPIPEDNFRTVNWAFEIYQQFAKKYEFEAFDLLQWNDPQPCKQCCSLKEQDKGKCLWCNGTGLQKAMVEVKFAALLYNHVIVDRHDVIPVYYHGTIDLPIILDDKLFTLDFKSTIMLGPTFWAEKKMSSQQLGYAWGLQQTTGRQVHGYVVRALRTAEPSQLIRNGKPNKKGEIVTLEKWWDESLCEDKYYLGEGQIEQWKQTTISLCEEFFWHYQRGFFPERGKTNPQGACSHKYGKCAYFDVCSLFPASDRPALLASGMFKDEEHEASYRK